MFWYQREVLRYFISFRKIITNTSKKWKQMWKSGENRGKFSLAGKISFTHKCEVKWRKFRISNISIFFLLLEYFVARGTLAVKCGSKSIFFIHTCIFTFLKLETNSVRRRTMMKFRLYENSDDTSSRKVEKLSYPSKWISTWKPSSIIYFMIQIDLLWIKFTSSKEGITVN